MERVPGSKANTILQKACYKRKPLSDMWLLKTSTAVLKPTIKGWRRGNRRLWCGSSLAVGDWRTKGGSPEIIKETACTGGPLPPSFTRPASGTVPLLKQTPLLNVRGRDERNLHIILSEVT